MALQALLYSADAKDQVLAGLDAVDPAALAARQLLWVDLCQPTAADVDQVARLLSCDARLFTLEAGRQDRPSLANFGDLFRVTAAAVALDDSHSSLVLDRLGLVSGRNVVVTVHDRPLPFLDDLREREKGETAIGALTSESFVASLLDRLLDSYFKAVEVLVGDVDRVEVALLGKRAEPRFVGLLVAVRKRLAQLRRLLKAHRDVFYGMARPDFMATEQPEARPHFEALERRYERVEDEVESARDLVIGAFELLSTRAAQAMNETMQTLTFVTVLMGVLALISGVMGMNFETSFFATGAFGFYTVIAAMLLLSGTAIWIARRRGWI